MYHIANDKRSKQSATWIYEALERLMETTEFSNIKITDVCREAKIGRVTFYRHYDTMEDVLCKRCDDKFDGLVEYFREFYRTSSNAEPFMKPFLRYWYVHSGILDLIIKADKVYIISNSFQRMFAILINYIPQMKNSIMEHKNYFFAMRVSFSIAILTEWIKEDKKIPPDDLTEILLNQINESMNLRTLL